MEAKKTESADLTKKSTFFFSIGLVISMTLVVTAFEWKDNEQSIADPFRTDVMHGCRFRASQGI